MTHETIPYATAARPELVNDRRGGLITFGVVSILIGTPPALIAVGTAMAVIQLGLFSRPFAALAVGLFGLVQAGVAAVFIWTGVDSIRCRRWVRPVIVALGWPAGVTSAFVFAGLLCLAAGGTPVGAAEGYVAMAVVVLIFGVVVPWGFVAFYSTKSVRETLAAYDPTPSWTERAPLPVFVGCVTLVGFGVLTVGLAVFRATPVFGVYVTGVPGALLAMGAGGAMIASAVLMFLGQRWGWWVALAVVAGGFASAIVTFARLGMMAFYRHGGMNEVALDEAARTPALAGATPVVFVAIVGAISVGYLLWVRRQAGGAAGPGAEVEAEHHAGK